MISTSRKISLIGVALLSVGQAFATVSINDEMIPAQIDTSGRQPATITGSPFLPESPQEIGGWECEPSLLPALPNNLNTVVGLLLRVGWWVIAVILVGALVKLSNTACYCMATYTKNNG